MEKLRLGRPCYFQYDFLLAVLIGESWMWVLVAVVGCYAVIVKSEAAYGIAGAVLLSFAI